MQKIQAMQEEAWVRISILSEQMFDYDRAISALENALRINPSPKNISALGLLLRYKNTAKAADLIQRIINSDRYNGELWATLGHCQLLNDDLTQAYQAYQHALNYLQNPKEPRLWYGIGILYDRYGSFEHAEAAYSAVIRIDPYHEKAPEIYFRLAMIYKAQQKFPLAIDCLKYISTCPPKPLTKADIWFHVGHVFECQRDLQSAREMYDRALGLVGSHAKSLMQIGYHYISSQPETAIRYLQKSLDSEPEPMTFYLLGRAYISTQKFNKAYELYQQAVLRDAKNPVFWCSIGVLYFDLSQHRDALDAFSRAIYLNPGLAEVWADLGKLYESCNNQTTDAIDAYTKVLELDPNNLIIKNRLALLKQFLSGGPSPGPVPQTLHPALTDPNVNIGVQTVQSFVVGAAGLFGDRPVPGYILSQTFLNNSSGSDQSLVAPPATGQYESGTPQVPPAQNHNHSVKVEAEDGSGSQLLSASTEQTTTNSEKDNTANNEGHNLVIRTDVEKDGGLSSAMTPEDTEEGMIE